jgi:nucleoside-diphosphate-sugar epimerase
VTRALVTGATGLVGSYIVERLLADDSSVRALVRDAGAAAWLSAFGAELAVGDLLDAESLRRAAAGCDTIYHCAALISAGDDWPSFRRMNVDGTRAVVDAAAQAGARLVHLSSVAVYDDSARYAAAPTSEDTPLTPLTTGSYYARSKREAEDSVMDAHARGRLWATAVRPTVIYGRRDRQFVPRAARVMRTGFFPLFGGGRTTMSLVHGSAVADGAVRAARTDTAGGRAYNLTNDFPVTVAQMVHYASLGLGRVVRGVPIPLPLARASFSALGQALRVARRPGLAEQLPGALNAFARNNPFTSERARRELGWLPTVTPEVGIPDAFAWWKEHRTR